MDEYNERFLDRHDKVRKIYMIGMLISLWIWAYSIIFLMDFYKDFDFIKLIGLCMSSLMLSIISMRGLLNELDTVREEEIADLNERLEIIERKVKE